VSYVSYRIDENGGYNYDQKIYTKNVVAVFDISNPVSWAKEKEFILDYNKVYDGLYVGLEDVRLFSHNETLMFSANRGLDYNNMVIETGKINIKSQATLSNLIYTDGQQKIEKNWVLFKDSHRQIRMIYGWYPLKMGIIEETRNIDEKNQITKQLVITSEEKTPNFFRWVRGSTNGVTIGDEIWFICHIVSYEERRYYYHLFVVLDLNTMKLKRYSRLFNFAGEKVEYTLGFVYIESEKQFLIGYSVMDRETQYMTITKRNIENIGFIDV